MTTEFDYIVIGAGSAGCVLADRLSSRPDKRVLVLEAGGNDNWIWFHIPVGYLFAIGNPRADWMFSTEPSAGLGGRQLNYPRGKVIGGCSAINAMIYMRGQAADYDRWRDLGLPGWGWDDVLPHFLEQEDHVNPPNALHRSGGRWHVDYPRMRWEILESFGKAAEQAGIPPVDDFNAGNNFGSGYFQINQKRGRRWSAARGFLKPALKRPNLTLETHAHVESLIIENNRAVGVRYRHHGAVKTVRATGEIVLAAGAVATPKLLELSGIGDGDHLQSLGIPVVKHLPGVGTNLQDHLQLRPIFKVQGVPTMNALYQSLWRRPLMALEYALFRRGPLSMAPSQFGAFAHSSSQHATPNLQFHIQPLSLDKFGDTLHTFPAFTTSVCNLRPTSRGTVHARSADPGEAPSIDPNYLSTNEDCQVAVEAIRLVRRIVSQPPLARYHPEEFKPGAEAESDEALEDAARAIGTTIFHPVGTAKMGPASDPMAVVDQRLRVYGIEGLRVADASVMPFITSGNTNSPTMMIAGKAAAMMEDDA